MMLYTLWLDSLRYFMVAFAGHYSKGDAVAYKASILRWYFQFVSSLAVRLDFSLGRGEYGSSASKSRFTPNDPWTLRNNL